MIKRCLDFSVAFIALIVLFPVLCFCAIGVYLKVGRPVLFRQTRPGHHGKSFTMIKFRTMSNATDDTGHLLPDSDRLGPFGKLLRSTSLDELPELWNVLCGDMSLVGPRPLLMEYLPLYTDREARRHDVKPGITGWAQINGRNNVSWSERFDMDVWYVEHHSLWLDIRILFLTIGKVLTRSDITQAGHETMPRFPGHQQKPAGADDER